MDNKFKHCLFADLKYLYFTAAAVALLWMVVSYAALNPVTIALSLTAACYSLISVAAGLNIVRDGRLFSGLNAREFSPKVRRYVQIVGFGLPLAALVYAGHFASTVKSFKNTDAGLMKICQFERAERLLLGKSVIWSYIPGFNRDVVLYDGYIFSLQRQIKRNWFPPKCGGSKRAVLTFDVERDGRVSNLKLKKSTESQICDIAALNAVERAGRLRPLPLGSPESVSIEFTLDYNVFGDAWRSGHDSFKTTFAEGESL